MKPNGLVIPPVPHSPSTTTTDAAQSFFKNLPPLFQQRNARDMCRKWNKILEQSKKNPKNFQHLNENCSKLRDMSTNYVNQFERKAGVRREKEPCLLILHSFEITSESPPTRSTHWLVLTCYTAPVYGFAQFNPNEGLR